MAQKQIQSGTNELICQRWQWKERGWDSEEDGFTLHLSIDALRQFIKEYWEVMPNVRPTPSEYSCPEGNPYVVRVDDATQFEVSLTGSMEYGPDVPYPATHPL